MGLEGSPALGRCPSPMWLPDLLASDPLNAPDSVSPALPQQSPPLAAGQPFWMNLALCVL
jgi:hypothetical protein